MARESRGPVVYADESLQGDYSFLCGVLVLAFGTLLVASFFLARYMATTPNQQLDALHLIGRYTGYTLIASLVGFVLGVVGVFREGYRKTLAIWGMAMNGVFSFGVLCLVLTVVTWAR